MPSPQVLNLSIHTERVEAVSEELDLLLSKLPDDIPELEAYYKLLTTQLDGLKGKFATWNMNRQEFQRMTYTVYSEVRNALRPRRQERRGLWYSDDRNSSSNTLGSEVECAMLGSTYSALNKLEKPINWYMGATGGLANTLEIAPSFLQDAKKKKKKQKGSSWKDLKRASALEDDFDRLGKSLETEAKLLRRVIREYELMHKTAILELREAWTVKYCQTFSEHVLVPLRMPSVEIEGKRREFDCSRALHVAAKFWWFKREPL